MGAGTQPIQTCDGDEVLGCGEYMVDYRAMGASNWRELLNGWTYDPQTGRALCPKHAAGAPATRCGRRVGSRPWWMSADQYDPCHCIRPAGHDGECWCEHTDPAASPEPAGQEGDRGNV